MAVPKKGWRKIIVDGLPYRWNIRRKPKYSEAIWGGLDVAIERISETKGTILLLRFSRYRPDSWMQPDSTPITPKNIEQYIRTALEKGWQSDSLGKPYILKEA